MNWQRARSAVAFLLIAAMIMSPGCSSLQTIPVAEPAPGAPPASSAKLRIRKLDGEKLTLHHWTLDGDTLRGTSEAWVNYEPVKKLEAIALRDVTLEDGIPEAVSPQNLPSTLGQPEKVSVRFADGKTLTVIRPKVDRDSLRGFMAAAGVVDGTEMQVAFALKDIQTIQVRRPSEVRTMALIVGVAILAVGAAVGIGVAIDSAQN